MKKKLLLMVAMIAVLVCLFAISVSAEKPAMYVEFKVKLSGSSDYTNAYVQNESGGNPCVNFTFDFYSDEEFTTAIDKSQIVAIDFSDAVTHGEGSKDYVDRSVAADASVFPLCEEVKWFSSGFKTTQSNTFKNWTQLKYFDFGCIEAIDYGFLANTGLESVVLPDSLKTLKNGVFTGCTSLVSVKIPSSFTSIANNVFQNCTSLEFVEFTGNSTNEKTIGVTVFSGCTKLSAISLPEGLKVLGQWVFQNCSSLKAIYLPSTITQIGTNGSYGESPFSGCSSAYFVQEPFSVLDENGNFYTSETFVQPVEPEIYYMPEGLTTLTGTPFNGFTNMNRYVVLPTTLTEITSWEGAFSTTGTNGEVTYIFLGKITTFKYSARDGRYKNVSYIFAHPENTGIESFELFQLGYKARVVNGYMYFCASNCYYDLNSFVNTSETYVVQPDDFTKIEGETIHLSNPRGAVSEAADCTNPESTTYYCFCGKELETKITAEKLGHTHADGVAYVSINYNGNYLANGYYVYVCDRCSENYDDETADAPALFVMNGYSHASAPTGAIMQSFQINKDAIANYNKYATTPIKYGILAASGSLTTLNSGTTFVDNVVSVDFTNRSYDIMEMKIYGITTATKDTALYCCGYIMVDGDIIYMDKNMAEGAELPATVTYAGLGGTFVAEASLDAVVPTKESEVAA